MHSLGITIVWCALQVTIVSALAVVAYMAARRFGPAGRSLVALSGLGAIVVLTLLAVSPWPRWLSEPNSDASSASPSRAEAAGTTINDKSIPDSKPMESSLAPTPPVHSEEIAKNRDDDSSARARVFASAFWDSFTEQLRQPAKPAETVSQRPIWPTYLAGLFLAGVAIGLVRLFLGLAAVRGYRREGRMIDDRRLTTLVDALRVELGCRRAVELRETGQLANAATVGWRRPIILLPVDWVKWSDVERRTVLAHELSHISRNDFLGWICAQVGLMLHFYHPLVHWLTRRLRLEQELACDAAAAAVAGGRESYLRVFAEMTLRQSDRRVSWPARTFLPTHTTLMRRIEMLRDGRMLKTTLSRGARLLTVGIVVAAGLFAAGFRSPGVDAAAMADTVANDPAAEEPVSNQPEADDAFAKPAADESGVTGLEYVPRDTMLLVSFRPAVLLSNPHLKSVASLLSKDDWAKKLFGVGLSEMDRFSMVILPQPNGLGNPETLVIRTREKIDPTTVAAVATPNPEQKTYDNKSYYRSKNESRKFAYFPDDHTLVFTASESQLRRVIVTGKAGPNGAPWATHWSETKGAQVVAMWNMARFKPVMDELVKKGGRETTMLRAFAPLWTNATDGLLTFTLNKQLTIKGVSHSRTAEDASKVEQALRTLVALGRTGLDAGRKQMSKLKNEQGPVMLRSIDAADKLLDGLKIDRDGSTLTLSARVDANDTAKTLALMLPAFGEAREAARRAQSANNLKQIALAMHNYHDTYGHFPPAVVIGPDGKTPHSWRVELLPILGQAALYKEYRMNEPWDSAHNKKLIARMPAIFRHPNEKEDSTHTSYFALTGEETVFSGKKGTKFRDITDGTSNTIMVVEAKRNVPWTQPVDIPYSATKPLPKFGGFRPDGFYALRCDGSVRSISHTIDEVILRATITKAGGETIP